MNKSCLKVGDKVRFFYEVYNQSVCARGHIVFMGEDRCEIDCGTKAIYVIPYDSIIERFKTKEELESEEKERIKMYREEAEATTRERTPYSGVEFKERRAKH